MNVMQNKAQLVGFFNQLMKRSNQSDGSSLWTTCKNEILDKNSFVDLVFPSNKLFILIPLKAF